MRNELFKIIDTLTKYVYPETYISLSDLVRIFINNNIRITDRSKFMNDLRRLGIITVYDKEFKLKPIYRTSNFRSDYAKYDRELLEIKKIPFSSFKSMVFKNIIRNNLFINKYITNHLIHYVEIPIYSAYNKLIKTVQDTYEQLGQKKTGEIILSQITRPKLKIQLYKYKYYLISQLEYLSNEDIKLDNKKDIIIINTENLRRYIAPLIIHFTTREFIEFLKKSFIDVLKKQEVYEEWKRGGAIYVSLLKVYEEFKKTNLGKYIKSYEEFILKCKQVASITDYIKLSVHPRYTKSRDKGYSIYISQYL